MKIKQRGMTFWGVIIITAMAAFCGMLVIKLFPVYYNDLRIKNALDVVKRSDANNRYQIIETFSRQLTIEDIKNIDAKQLKLEPNNNGFSANLDYEVRVPIIYNIDAMVKFSHNRDLP